MPGKKHDTFLLVFDMSTGLGIIRHYFYPHTDADRKAGFAAEIQWLDQEYNSSRIAISVLFSSDDSTDKFIPIQDPILKANRELQTWLDRLPIILVVYPPPFLPLVQQPVNSFDTSDQYLYALARRYIERSPDTQRLLHNRLMDEFDNAQAANAQLNGADDADDAELFGSDSGSDQAQHENVESGDEEPRESAKDDINDNKDPVHTREENVIDVSIGKHAIPKPSDGEVSSHTPQQLLTMTNTQHSFTSCNSPAILVLNQRHSPQATGSLLLASITPPRPHHPHSPLSIPQIIPSVGGTHQTMQISFNPTPVSYVGQTDP